MGPNLNRGRGDDFAVLDGQRRADDLIGFAVEPKFVTRQRIAQRQIPDGGLAAGVDDGLGAHVADDGVDDDQLTAGSSGTAR